MKGYKTIIIAVLSVVAAFVPGMKDWIAANPQEYATIIGTIMIVLRMVTKTPVGGGKKTGNLPALMPLFLAVAAASTLSSCKAGGGMDSVFKGLSGRIGTDGGGGIAEVTLPPGYGVGIKIYPVTPISSKLPQITPLMTNSYPPAKNVE